VEQVREVLETRQVAIYFVAIAIGALVGLSLSGATALEVAINPALAIMLFVTFLQVPLAELGKAIRNMRFLGALLLTNFVVMPVVTAVLVQFLPSDPMLRLAVLFVLLTPCIDYVVTFTHLGRGDARLLLGATPALLLLQMVLLPVYLQLLLGGDASALVQPGPFIHAFVWLIVVPLMLAGGVQIWAALAETGRKAAGALGLLPVLSTALVLFLVLASVMPRIGEAGDAALTAVPIYVIYAIAAPVIGGLVASALGLETAAIRAVSFSAATRNSLVVMPLAFAVPGGVPLVPAVIVTQTIIELVSELLYVRWIPRLSRRVSI
jgi:ACR3 family arsenite transporter